MSNKKQKTQRPHTQSPPVHPRPPSLGKGWGYGFGAALIFLGLAAVSVALGSAMRSATRGVQRFPFPGVKTLPLQAGLHLGAYVPEKDGARAPETPSFRLTGEDGFEIPLTRPAAAQLAFGGKRGELLFQTDIPSPGRYTLEAGAPVPPGSAPREGLLIHESVGNNRGDVTAGVLLLLVLGGSGVYVLAATHRSSRADAG